MGSINLNIKCLLYHGKLPTKGSKLQTLTFFKIISIALENFQLTINSCDLLPRIYFHECKFSENDLHFTVLLENFLYHEYQGHCHIYSTVNSKRDNS